MKKCSKCGDYKELSEFPKDSRTKSGLTCHCRSCRSAYRKTYWQKNPEKQKFWHKKTITRSRYNLTLEQAEELYSRGCEICGSRKKLCIDHCHKTGRVRGCLCDSCNHGLGRFKDSTELLNKTITYLGVRYE